MKIRILKFIHILCVVREIHLLLKKNYSKGTVRSKKRKKEEGVLVYTKEKIKKGKD